MSDPLGTYLHDHLAGAAYAIELVEFMRDIHNENDLGGFAAGLLAEIKEDRDTLRQIAARVGASGSTMKEMASWLGEKLSRIKLGHGAGNGLATFEALEFLAIGIHGKLALWRVLAVAAPSDARLAGIDFERLAARAQKQHDKVDKYRLRAARTALKPDAIAPSECGERAATQISNLRYRRGLKPCNHPNAGSAVRKTTVVGSALLVLGVVVAVSMLPDIVRYMKIRAM
jgi:hypothetical protein